ncbi:MAG: hypothetical protein S4CHLAM102_08490 [Chlamydiia bacterium]|nr:hypothetical protein [Chlamydiia bacterium]
MTRSKWQSFPIYLITFYDVLAFTFIFPIFARMMLDPTWGELLSHLPYRHRPLFFSLLTASYPTGQLIATPFFKLFGEKYGEKNLFSIGAMGMGIALLFSGLAIHWDTFILLIICRFLTGVFAGNFILTVLYLVQTAKTKEEVLKTFSFFSTFTGLIFIVGILYGGTLTNGSWEPAFHAAFPFYILAAFSIIVLLALFFFHPGEKTDRNIEELCECFSWKYFTRVHKQHRFNFFFLMALFILIAWMLSLQFLNIFMISEYHINSLETICILVAVGAMWLFSSIYLMRRIRAWMTLIPALVTAILIAVLAALAIALVDNFILTIIAFLILSGAMGAIWGHALDTLVNKLHGASYLEHIGYKQAILLIGAALAPLIAAPLSILSLRLVYCAAALSLLLALAILLTRSRHHRSLLE